MRIECPAEGCGRRFDDRNRASLITALGADTAGGEVNSQQAAATRCPECGKSIEFGLLMRDDDSVWRVSPFAGHADDVTVVAPPGGGVAYQGAVPRAPDFGSGAAGSEARGPGSGLTGSELTLRDRALAAIAGNAPQVSVAAQLDAVELALEAGVLEGEEVAGARAWLESRRR